MFTSSDFCPESCNKYLKINMSKPIILKFSPIYTIPHFSKWYHHTPSSQAKNLGLIWIFLSYIQVHIYIYILFIS